MLAKIDKTNRKILLNFLVFLFFSKSSIKANKKPNIGSTPKKIIVSINRKSNLPYMALNKTNITHSLTCQICQEWKKVIY